MGISVSGVEKFIFATINTRLKFLSVSLWDERNFCILVEVCFSHSACHFRLVFGVCDVISNTFIIKLMFL